MKVEPRSLQGFMELYPSEQIMFNKIKNIIESTYRKYGFFPLDTPTIEYSEVLLAKAGGETEKQIYRFNKGDNDLSLRFDLTVPLAKYVAARENELVFPFKRYQIGKVFRGERPQRGRYREFYQCDIDVIGKDSLSINYDSEMPIIINEIFEKLNFGKFIIRINNRKLLNGLFEYLEVTDKQEALRIIDKIDKIGKDEVKRELLELGIKNNNVDYLIDFMTFDGDNDSKINYLKSLDISNENYINGLNELEIVTNNLKAAIEESNFKIDFSIARGLDYYTGTVYETNIIDYPELGSVCSGGRYDSLAEFYTDSKLPGVGISIGLTRLFFQLMDKQIIKIEDEKSSDVIILPMDNDITYTLKVAKELLKNDIKTNTCYIEKGMKQKFKYADRLGSNYVIIIGESEKENNTVSLKNMLTGEQIEVSIEDAIKKIKE